MTNLTGNAKLGGSILGVLALAGCLQVPNNAVRQGPGGLEIQITEGRNCWENSCFSYDAAQDQIAVSGRAPIPVPAGVDLGDGYASEAEIAALLSAARQAPLVAETDGKTETGAPSGPSGTGDVD